MFFVKVNFHLAKNNTSQIALGLLRYHLRITEEKSLEKFTREKSQFKQTLYSANLKVQF